VFYVEGDFWPLNTTLYVEDFKGNEPRYASYLLRTLDLETRGVASAVPGVNRNDLHRIEVCVPPRQTQQGIAEVLSAYDALIAANRRRIEVLDTMTRLLYREWFVRFRYPGHEAVGTTSSSIGSIPSGWGVGAVGEVAAVIRGRSYRRDQLVEQGGVPFVNLKCVNRGGGFRRSGLKRYAGPAAAAQHVTQGDVVVAVTDMTTDRGIVAQPARVPILDDGPGVVSMDLVKIEPSQSFQREFIYAMLRDSGFPETVREHANGTNVLHLAPELVASYLIPVPPFDLRQRYSDIVGNMFRLAEAVDAMNVRLVGMLDITLPRLIHGEIELETARELLDKASE